MRDGGVEEFFGDAPPGPGTISDVALIERLVRQAAQEGRALSYSEILMQIGHRFTRPKMRALCATLDEVDRRAAAAGEPELAVLVVRESDRLPGQGWWTGRTDYAGAWEGAEAYRYITEVQGHAFRYWKSRSVG
jgi:hypothetical protein